jgi:hypothetical protein
MRRWLGYGGARLRRAAAAVLGEEAARLWRRWTAAACSGTGAEQRARARMQWHARAWWRAATAVLGITARAARVRALADGGDGLKREQDLDVRLKRLRSAFHAMTGRGGRMTRRGKAASSQSPVSSWNDRTRPVRHDRTLIGSGQILPLKLKRMTGRGGGGRDRTRWSATMRPVQRSVTDPREVLWDDRTR